jgi:putative hemolysin
VRPGAFFPAPDKTARAARLVTLGSPVDDYVLKLALVAVLVLLNACFAGSEMALISLREGQIRRLAEGDRRRRLLAQLARDPNRFLATVQLGITLAGFLASAAAAVSLAEPLVEPLSFLDTAAEPAAIVVVTLVLAFLTLVIGELAPKRVALQRAERWGLLAARPLAALAILARPAVWLLATATDVTVRLMGGDPSVQREEITRAELRDMVATGSSLSRSQRHLLAEAFEIEERTVAQIVIPRPSVLFLQGGTDTAAGVRLLLASGHSRAPVVRESPDDVVGVAHLRDLLDASGTVGEHVRPPLLLPETAPVLDALRQLQSERQKMALVVDEHGGIEGIVTVEDILEELVGELYDEFDRDVRATKRDRDGSLVLPGSFPIHDLPDVGVSLPEGPYTTVAGLVLDRLGRLPELGDVVALQDWSIEVQTMSENAIRSVRLSPRAGRAASA